MVRRKINPLQLCRSAVVCEDDDAPPRAAATPFQRALPQFLAVGVKNVLLLSYGMTIGFPTIVIPAIQGGQGRNPHGDIILNKDEISWFSSINLLCVPLGCIFSGMFTQPIGKRRAMQFVNIPIICAWLLFHFSTNIYHLYGGLCLAGLSGGLMEAPVLTYVAEVTEPRFRGMLSATGSTCVILGVFIQFLLGSLLPWRTIALISVIFPLISITALFFVPESPHWLVTKGRYLEAQRALAWLRGWVPISHVQQEYQQIYDTLVPASVASSSACKSIDAPDHQHQPPPQQSSYWSRTIRGYCRKSFLVPYALITFTFFVGHFSGKTTLQTYAVQIFHTLKAPIDKYYATVLLGGVEIVGTLVCVVLVHSTGKRPLVLISTVGCGLCFLGTATYARFLNEVPGVVVENVVANVSAVRGEEFLTLRNLTTILDTLGDDDDDDGNAKMMMTTTTWTPMGEFNNLTTTTTTPMTTTLSPLMNETMHHMNGSSIAEEQPKSTASSSLPFVVRLGADEAPIPDEILLHIPYAEENRYSWVPLTLLLLSALFAHMGIKLIPWMLIGEVFPAAVRSGASGISGGTGYIFGFLANKLFLSMLNTMTMPGTFWFYSAVALIGSVVLYFVLPETEGRTLMEIEQHFAGSKTTTSRMIASAEQPQQPERRITVGGNGDVVRKQLPIEMKKTTAASAEEPSAFGARSETTRM